MVAKQIKNKAAALQERLEFMHCAMCECAVKVPAEDFHKLYCPECTKNLRPVQGGTQEEKLVALENKVNFLLHILETKVRD